MSGCYRRAIVLRAEPGCAHGEIEDDFHHFAVAVRHNGAHVTGAEGRAVRYPWSQCPMAAAALSGLIGMPLTSEATAIYRQDPLGQCTHMLEVAGLVIAQAARGGGARRYDLSLSDPQRGRCEAELRLDGALLEHWTLEDGVVVEPAARRGLRPAALRSGALAGRPDAEVLLILRRAIALATARGLDVDRFATAAAMGRGRACYVFSPGVAEVAARRYGSVRDFSTGPGPLSGDPP